MVPAHLALLATEQRQVDVVQYDVMIIHAIQEFVVWSKLMVDLDVVPVHQV